MNQRFTHTKVRNAATSQVPGFSHSRGQDTRRPQCRGSQCRNNRNARSWSLPSAGLAESANKRNTKPTNGVQQKGDVKAALPRPAIQMRGQPRTGVQKAARADEKTRKVGACGSLENRQGHGADGWKPGFGNARNRSPRDSTVRRNGEPRPAMQTLAVRRAGVR